MNPLMEQRVMRVAGVHQLIAPDPGPDGVGQWRVTFTDDHAEQASLVVCDPPCVGDYVFVEVVAIDSAAPVGGGF